MATTPITVASFQTTCAEMADAVEIQDWDTAYIKLLKAESINLGLELRAADGGSSLQRRQSLGDFRKLITETRADLERSGDNKRFVTTRTKGINY